MQSLAVKLCVLGLMSSVCAADDTNSPDGPPAWFLDEIKTLTAETGRWETDNSRYKSEGEPYEKYATEWVASFDGTTMTGRLFGISDGKDADNFWEFRQYWHPQKKVVVLEQFGWGGVVGLGTAWQDGASTRSEQTFYAVEGSATVTGHVSTFSNERTHVTKSFDVDGDKWKPRREYTWYLVEE